MFLGEAARYNIRSFFNLLFLRYKINVYRFFDVIHR